MAAGARTIPARSSGPLAWVGRHRFELALIAPLVVYVTVLTIAPIFDTIRISLLGEDGAFTTDNYGRIFGQQVFRQAVVNTVIVALVSLTLELTVGLAIALALNAKFFGRGFVRTVTLIPLGVPTIVSGAVMLLLFGSSGYLNSIFGFVVDLFNKIPGVEMQFRGIDWTITGGLRTLFTIAIADMWKVLPVITLIFLAGLQSIPEDVYEAADVDGATKWQRFSRVTLPLLIPYITIALILRAIDAFRIFELALVLSGRIEPVLGTYIWNQYAPPTSNPFTSAAASIVLFGIIMVFIIIYLRVVARRGDVQL
ncbi:MAG TPA: sugar ABC transporter permease [Actinomycetota bacterium]|nr:sugar ABC transporter permease [Actinomycetota bacterium]